AAVGRKASVHTEIVTVRPSTLFKPLPESREARRHFRIALGQLREYGDPANSVGLLRARRKRPRDCAAEQRDELAAPIKKTRSHRTIAKGAGLAKRPRSTKGLPFSCSRVGRHRPSAFAVVRLTTRSNLVGCSTGMSAGFAPRRILST